MCVCEPVVLSSFCLVSGGRKKEGKGMESDKTGSISKEMKVVVLCGSSESGMKLQGHGGGGLTRQSSMSKTNCLCSPTTHAGSFRCRLHRIEPASSPLPDQPSTLADADISKDQVL